jgi:hypothetical protein
MKKYMTITLESGQLLSIRDSDKSGCFEIQIDDLKVALNRKESEIVVAAFDNFLG